jgi:hypothetical protein
MGRTWLVLGALALGCGHGGGTNAPGENGAPAAAAARPDSQLPPLSEEEILRGMQDALYRMRTCPSDPPGSPAPHVQVTVAPTGRVTEVRTLGQNAPSPAASCRAQAIKLSAFRANPGTTFDYVFPIP